MVDSNIKIWAEFNGVVHETHGSKNQQKFGVIKLVNG